MPRYFTHADYFTNSTNKLTDEFQQLLRDNSNLILESDEVFAAWRNNMDEHVAILNKKHPRCKPICPYWNGLGGGPGINIENSKTISWTYGLWSGCMIGIYKAKN